MIPINFDPAEFLKSASLPFVPADLLDPASLAVRLKESPTPLSNYLHSLLTPEGQQLIAEYDGTSDVSAALAGALLACLNEALKDPLFSERKRFAGIEPQREILIRGLRKQELADESLTGFNRLLLEDAYPRVLAKSLKAEWDGWSLLARAATRRVIGEWEDWKAVHAAWQAAPQATRGKEPKFNPSFEDDTWKGFRNWLLDNVFHNKCAYCETPHVGFPGDAEHFRPKGRVRVRSQNDDLEVVTIVDENNQKISHPGYFWLAYHWKNLLPACETCNRGGKNDLFPVKNPHVAVKRLTVQQIDELIHKMTESENEKNIFYLEPDDLDQMEGRLLLHPYHDDPKKHIYFKTDGTVAAWQGSDQGTASITVYNLNAEKTVKARQREQVNGHRDYTDMVLKAIPDLAKARESALSLKAEYYNGEKPYGAAVFDFIHFYLDKSLVDPEILLKESTAADPEKPSN